MGYATYGIGVSISKIESVISSQDREFLSIAIEDEGLNAVVDGQLYTIDSAFHDLVAGNLNRSLEASHLFVYAIEQLCLHFGQRLDGEGNIKYLDDLDWGLNATPLTSHFKLAPTNVFPDGQILELAQVKKRFSLLENDTEHEDGAVEDGREDYVWWLQQCIEANADLVTFCY